jgi:hypothetical protein
MTFRRSFRLPSNTPSNTFQRPTVTPPYPPGALEGAPVGRRGPNAEAQTMVSLLFRTTPTRHFFWSPLFGESVWLWWPAGRSFLGCGPSCNAALRRIVASFWQHAAAARKSAEKD